jgi:hypothetical protein
MDEARNSKCSISRKGLKEGELAASGTRRASDAAASGERRAAFGVSLVAWRASGERRRDARRLDAL